MKALELTIYPPLICDGDRPRDRLKHEFAKGAEWKRGQAKRLNDAELAAEVHHAELVCWVRRSRCDRYPEPIMWDHYERGIEQSFTLHRFATLPHYDEDPR